MWRGIRDEEENEKFIRRFSVLYSNEATFSLQIHVKMQVATREGNFSLLKWRVG